MAYKDIQIPTIPKTWVLPKREYPITPRENLMRALNHEKPMWMPDLFGSSQCFLSSIANDSPKDRAQETEDWFGVKYKYSPIQGSNTPSGNGMKCITEWETYLTWPDLSQYDWKADTERLVRDENLALYMRMSNGPFERLHMMEGFEQALIDILVEPEAVRAFMERLVDFKIDLFSRIREHLELDYILAGDDWGTSRAPFFSTATFEETILEPTKRFVKAVQATGTKFIAHNCGVIEPFIPYLVEEIGVDGLEIQNLNDIDAILKKYGDRVTIECKSNPQLVYDPDTTEEQVREYIRSEVDRYGAHAVPGAGVVFNPASNFEHIFYPLEEELYTYSKARYADIT